MALDPNQQDAVAYLSDLLRGYGLESLSDWAYQQVVQGHSPTMIRQLLWEQPAFKQRFHVIFDRQAKGLPAISVDEVLSYEQNARQLFQSAGLPPGFYDSPEDFASFLDNDVSLNELSARVDLAKEYIYSSDATIRGEVKRLYGLSDGQEIAYVLDSAKALPLIQSQFLAAKDAAASFRSGYGELTQSEAEQLAARGVDPTQAESRFGTLVQSRQLFNALPGQESSDSPITRQQQLSAAFGGDALAQEQIQRRAEERVAAFGQGGTFAAGQEGFAGLGSANK